MLTIKEIAKRAGVAKSTVSRYLNGGSVSKKTKKKLDELVAETGYTPNLFAQSLKAKKTNMIGTIVPRLNSYSANEVLTVVDEELRKQSYQLLITNTNQRVEREIESVYSLAKQKVAGILLFATVVTEDHLKAIEDVGIPVIVLGQYVEGLHTIVHEEFEAGYKMGSYANQLGHRDFLYLSVFEADIAVGQLRKKGVLDALNEQEHSRVEVIETSFSFDKAYELALEILPKTTATFIICATDNIALAVMKAAHRLGLDVPKDFSLSGFGGYDVTTVVTPSITTVKYAYTDLGRAAVGNILKLIDGEVIPKSIRLTNELTENESAKRKE